MTLKQKKVVTAYTFLAVPIVFFLFVRFFPMVYSMAMSFTDWNLLKKNINFVGLNNYIKIFNDPVFVTSLFNSLKYILFGAPLVIIISLLIALLLNKIRKIQWLYRLLYVMPYITPMVAVSWVWRWMYQPLPLGVFNNALVALGMDVQPFLSSPSQALFCIVVTTVWVEFGYCVVIFLAGIQTIPEEYLEAARIDGASRWNITMKITVPLLRPITLFLVVTESIQFLRLFTQVYNMSFQGTGGPLDSTKPMALYIYHKAFVNFDMGVASSASFVLFLIIMFITFLQLRVFKDKVSY